MRSLFLTALVWPCAALAQDAVPAQSQAELYPPLPGVEYYCTDARGTRFEIGQVICITASCQTWTARCDMSLNNPIWRKMQDGCPAAGLLQRLSALG